MIKRETFSLLSMIQGYYEQFEVDQMKLDLWHEAVRPFELEDLKQNLLTFVKNSSFPPKVSDLVSKAPMATSIPDSQETMQIINTIPVTASKEAMDKHLAKIRKTLGIMR